MFPPTPHLPPPQLPNPFLNANVCAEPPPSPPPSQTLKTKTIIRAKAELLAREKENDARLTSARKAVDQATERSQRMRTHYEEQLRKMQSKLDQTHGRLEAVTEKAAAEATAAEERHRDAMAEVRARANHAAAQREERLTEQVALLRQELDAAKSRALQRSKEVVASEVRTGPPEGQDGGGMGEGGSVGTVPARFRVSSELTFTSVL